MTGELQSVGATLWPAAALTQLGDFLEICDPMPDRAGRRLTDLQPLEVLLNENSSIGLLAGNQIGFGARPVRAVLFNKSPAANWSLGWHQDRTIAVRSRIDVSGFGPFTVKSGLLHVAPPISIVERMLTLRIHLDNVDSDNAPLLVASGTHRLGWIKTNQIGEIVERSEVIRCVARPGDVWAYSTPILHASERAMRPRQRRVLQVDYAAFELPGGLEWLGL